MWGNISQGSAPIACTMVFFKLRMAVLLPVCSTCKVHAKISFTLTHFFSIAKIKINLLIWWKILILYKVKLFLERLFTHESRLPFKKRMYSVCFWMCVWLWFCDNVTLLNLSNTLIHHWICCCFQFSVWYLNGICTLFLI